MWRPLFFLTLTGSACLNTPDLTGSSGDPATTDEPPGTGPQTTTGVSSGSTTTADIGSSGDSTGTTAPITADLTTSDASDTSDTTGADDTTGAPLEKCGDGVVDAELGEECDQADGCHHCIRDRIVFTSAETLSGAEIAGLDGADDLCLQYAGAAGLPNPLTYQAWLSDSTQDARDRLFLSEGRYLTTAGALVVIGKQEWLSGQLRAAIDHDQHGQPTVGSVWTGTTGDGVRVDQAPDEMKYCKDWTSSDLFDNGYIGSSQSTDGTWTLYTDDGVNPTSCGFGFKLYCMEGK